MKSTSRESLVSDRFLNADRAAYFIPVAAGLFLSIIAGIFIMRPIIFRANKSHQTLLEYRIKSSKLELELKRYEIIEANLRRLKLQKKGLVNLVTGSAELNTLLSKINSFADSNDLEIVELIPQEISKNIPIPVISTPNLNNETNGNILQSGISKGINMDPFLVENIIKYPYKITLNGYYPDLLEFLRDLELLEFIVITSDVKLSQVVDSTNSLNTPSKSNTNKVRLSMTISAYGNSMTPF